ncbi:hypothetical protein QNH46_13640 [Paenibacillus woosongensis]|uniref:Uncharacterized protein n=1 Tax=Paenibacillus woosongensis TaxID=307580 RepID=A0AA95I001_9BACL|nr:hypothetical protein [Paenibacillus woosongensis]WHX47211.1 hypothetical protein QNH46_13640 [Paenibacillus woosongensis]
MRVQTGQSLRIFKVGLVIVLLMIISGLLGSNDRRDQDVLNPYLAQDKNAFSLLILAEESDYMNQTNILNEMIGAYPGYFSQAGVLTTDSGEGKKIRDELDVRQVPAYLLLDHVQVILVDHDLAAFRSDSAQMIEERRLSR